MSSDEKGTAAPIAIRTHAATWVLLGLVTLAGFLFRLNELGQLSIKDLDEAYHAIVARNLMDDPLRPMLYEKTFLGYDYRNWMANHIWLHKPPLALWQMAGSMAFFTESNFAMRLPSLLLSTASVVLTFMIAKSLGDPRAGLVAAAFQSLCPAITRLVHGQVFSDHIDTALLFYCELSVWTLIRAAQSGVIRQAVVAGVFMGLGWLTKSFPATFVFGLAIALWLIPRWTVSPGRLQLSARQVALFALGAILVCVPWVAWCSYSFPREYWYEQVHVFRHLSEDIEAFGNPWDRLLFDYMVRVLLEWYPLVLVSFGLLAIDVVRYRNRGGAVILLWALGVFVPHLLATSKTPSATLIGWPALWIAAGFCVSDALRGRAIAIGIIVASGVVLLQPAREIAVPVREQVEHFAQIMLSQWRLLIEIGVVIVLAAVVYRFRKSIGRVPSPKLAMLLVAIYLFPVGRHIHLSYRTGADAPRDPVAFPQLGRFVRDHSPEDAVFFVDNLARGEHLIAMWWFDRPCYPLLGDKFGEQVNEVLANGGVPFIVSRGERPEPVLRRVEGETTIYRLDGGATSAGKK